MRGLFFIQLRAAKWGHEGGNWLWANHSQSVRARHPAAAKRHGRLFLIAALSALSITGARADVKLPAILSDHMILAKAARVPIWGRAEPGEEVNVTLAGQSAKARTGEDGKWRVSLNLQDSSPGPFEMTVQGKNKLTVSDVLVGEVWVASGQSNMNFLLQKAIGAQEEIASPANPMLRQFTVKLNPTPVPADDTEGRWEIASPKTVGNFTAVGYFFGKRIQNDLKVPVGLVHCAVGGSPVEAWLSPQAVSENPDLEDSRKHLWEMAKEYPQKRKTFVEGMGAWIKDNNREDQPTSDAGAYAGVDVSTEGWVSVKFPGPVKAPGLPETGVVWLRQEIDVPVKTGGNLRLFLPINGFDSVYWNGKLRQQTTYADFPGTGYTRAFGRFVIQFPEIKQGKNVLAIRLYQPQGPAQIFGVPRAGEKPLRSGWLAKAEREFPPLDKETLARAPKAPLNLRLPQHTIGYLFNGMIHPILPYAISGVIWYQGESNNDRSYQYRTSFPLLISGWRQQWEQGEFPFYFCQLPNYGVKSSEPEENGWAELREAQSLTTKVANTGQAVLIDIGEAEDVHPRNKKDAGERLALVALAKHYGRSIPYSGPVYKSMKIKSGKIILGFQHAESGLVAKTLPKTYDVVTEFGITAPLVRNSPNSELEGFAICGEDKKWVWADARIDGANVIVWSDKVPTPVAVRYAWAGNPTCNLYNGSGLPAGPFRTDDFPPITLNAKYR